MHISLCCSPHVCTGLEPNWREGALIHYAKSFVALDQLWFSCSCAGGERELARQRCKTLGSARDFGGCYFRSAVAVDRHCIFIFAARYQARSCGVGEKYFAGRHISVVGNYPAAAAKQSGRQARKRSHCLVCSGPGMDKFCLDEIAQGKLKALVKIPHNPLSHAARLRGIFRFHRDVKNCFDVAR